MSRTSVSFTGNAMSVLERVSQRLKPIAAKDDKVEVEINLGVPFERWLEEYYDFLLFMASERNHPLGIELEDLRRYVATLIDSRVKWVNRGHGRVLHYSDQVAVPTFIHIALSAIGRAEDEKRGINFVPRYTPTVELLTADECEAISRRLKPLSHMGVSFTYGFTREHNGLLDFMAMQYLVDHIDHQTGIFSHDEHAKAYSLVAYVLQTRHLQDFLGDPRIIYGNDSTLSQRIFDLIDMERKAS